MLISSYIIDMDSSGGVVATLSLSPPPFKPSTFRSKWPTFVKHLRHGEEKEKNGEKYIRQELVDKRFSNMDCVGDIAKHFLLFMSFEMTGKGINNLNRLFFFFFGLILKRGLTLSITRFKFLESINS